MIWFVLLVLGIGLATGEVVLLVASYLEGVTLPGTGFKFLAWPKIKPKFEQTGLNLADRKVVICGLAGMVLGFFFGWGTRLLLLAVLLGGAVGIMTPELVRIWRGKSTLDARRREISILFEAVELYMRAGMPMHHALTAAKTLTPNLRPAVNKCLTYWPSGAAKALQVLEKEMNLPEGDILVSLLMQVEHAGIENLEGIIHRESRRIEQMREAAEKANLSLKPLYLVLYRALPLLATLGMVAGTLFMRTLSILKDAGLM